MGAQLWYTVKVPGLGIKEFQVSDLNLIFSEGGPTDIGPICLSDPPQI